MMRGPFASWHEAVRECCTKLNLMIVQHQWDRGRLYVATVPHPAKRN